MPKKIFLTMAIMSAYTLSFGQNNVGLFEHCNYGGKKAYLGPGSYRLYQMKMDNDALSSMQIPTGMRVTLYEDDNFSGRSSTYTYSTACLPDGWNDNASSMVVESTFGNTNNNQNDFITFYTDCYSKGYSQSLKPGTYYGNQLGQLRENISSFTISGNLRVKVYTANDNAYGYSVNFESSESCLAKNVNDKIRSLVIEYKPISNQPTYPTNNNNNYNNSGAAYVSIYTDCNYSGSSLRLAPGYYQGDKLGLLRFDISSIEIPSNLKAKVFLKNDLSGYSYTLSENSNCLSNTLNNQIGSIIIEQRTNSGYDPNYNQNNDNNNNYNNNQVVVIYSDGDYKGLSASLLPGTYATMEQAGFIDDALSSLKIPAGYRVVLYEFPNFKGKNYSITQSKPGFIMSGWNDKASSIAVYRD